MESVITADMILNKKEKEEVIAKAISLGWSVEDHSPLRFSKGIINIWQCRTFWQCADLEANNFRNHRSYNNILTALEKE